MPQTDGQTNRQMDRQSDRGRDRQTESVCQSDRQNGHAKIGSLEASKHFVCAKMLCDFPTEIDDGVC